MINILIVLLLIFISYFIIQKLAKETFNTFDDVLNKKCKLLSKNQLDDYPWDTRFKNALCNRSSCPVETCHELVPDQTMTSYGGYHYRKNELPQNLVEDPNNKGLYMCQTKNGQMNDKQVELNCLEEPEKCHSDSDKYCWTYENKKWVKKTYKKYYNELGQCAWRNVKDNTDIKDDFQIDNCIKQKPNCNSSRPNTNECYDNPHQPRSWGITSEDGLTCGWLDECDVCEGPSKICWTYDRRNREYIPTYYDKRYHNGRCGWFSYEDRPAPRDCEEGFDGEPPMDVSECLNSFQCVDINNDISEMVSYRPQLDINGVNCEYVVDGGKIPRSLPIKLNTAECPYPESGYCSKNKYLDMTTSVPQCKECIEGSYLINKNASTQSTACGINTQCDAEIDYCYEQEDEQGYIFRKTPYAKIPDNELCMDNPSKPSPCKETCGDESTYGIEIDKKIYTYCYEPPEGYDYNDNTNTIEKVYENDCDVKFPKQVYELYNDKTHKFDTYNAFQKDKFTECVLKKNGSAPGSFELNLQDFENQLEECPYGTIENPLENERICNTHDELVEAQKRLAAAQENANKLTRAQLAQDKELSEAELSAMTANNNALISQGQEQLDIAMMQLQQQQSQFDENQAGLDRRQQNQFAFDGSLQESQQEFDQRMTSAQMNQAAQEGRFDRSLQRELSEAERNTMNSIAATTDAMWSRLATEGFFGGCNKSPKWCYTPVSDDPDNQDYITTYHEVHDCEYVPEIPTEVYRCE